MQRPRGVVLLAILALFLAGSNLLTGILLINGTISFEQAMGHVPDLGDMQPQFEQSMKVTIVLLSVLGLVLGVGLLRMKNWARALIRAFAVLGLLGALIQIIQAFTTKAAFSFLFFAATAGAYYWAFFYLGQKEIRAAFAPPPPAGSQPPPAASGPDAAP